MHISCNGLRSSVARDSLAEHMLSHDRPTMRIARYLCIRGNMCAQRKNEGRRARRIVQREATFAVTHSIGGLGDLAVIDNIAICVVDTFI